MQQLEPRTGGDPAGFGLDTGGLITVKVTRFSKHSRSRPALPRGGSGCACAIQFQRRQWGARASRARALLLSELRLAEEQHMATISGISTQSTGTSIDVYSIVSQLMQRSKLNQAVAVAEASSRQAHRVWKP